jgi:hypothetical protein
MRLAPLTLCAALICPLGCSPKHGDASRTRSDAVASASRAMSGPSLLTREELDSALSQLRAKAPGKLLRLEIRPKQLLLQAEDRSSPGTVVELRYRDGKVSAPEQATIVGKGQLADNLFELSEVKIDAVPELAQKAVHRLDPENGTVELVLVRRALPESDEVRIRVYVNSPRQSGYVDADRTGQIL